MYVDWIAYILFFVDWIDVDSECWWISLELIELYVIVEMCLFGNEIDNVIVMWIDIEKWWVESEFDWIVFVVENDVKVECDEMRNEMLIMKEWIELLRLWIWDFDELDWIVELCELHVFDGNEWVVLNGWLIYVKPRKKRRDEIESICYMMKWEIGQCEIAPKDWYWKRCPERENDWYEKKMPKWEKNVMRKMKMVYLLLIFLFRQLNELSILIENCLNWCYD